MVHIRNRRSQEAVRWYVLTLPTAVGGRDNIYSSKGLDAELSRRYALLTRAPVDAHQKQAFDVVSPRLACVKPVASVHPEPGSNSPL